jgi:Rieske Fe-S protein
MPDEDQDRFEDYQELERFIEQLQEDHATHPPAGLTPEQARVYQMAALFRSAAPDAAEPRPEFAEELYTRLEQELHQLQEHRPEQSRHLVLPWKKREGRARKGGMPTSPAVSRRSLIAGGAAVAASLVAGAAIEHEIEHSAANKPAASTASQWQEQLISADQPTTWLFVTTLAELGDKAVRFATDTIVGYVIRDNSVQSSRYGGEESQVIALSAACTHMGCLLQWQASARTFRCPCHGGLFTEKGEPDPQSPLRYLTSLPRLQTKVENGNVYVQVPAGTH